MTELKVGDRLRDNDPRMDGRVLTITMATDPNYVRALDGGARGFNILRRRIHTDGKPRRGGFDLIQASPHKE